MQLKLQSSFVLAKFDPLEKHIKKQNLKLWGREQDNSFPINLQPQQVNERVSAFLLVCHAFCKVHLV